MNIFSWLFGGASAADNMIGGIQKGIDALVYTDEEKAVANKKGFELYIEYQKATAPQNVARRMIAVMLTGLFVTGVLAVAVTFPFAPAYSKFLFKLMADVVLVPFGMVMTFYFLKRMGFIKEN